MTAAACRRAGAALVAKAEAFAEGGVSADEAASVAHCIRAAHETIAEIEQLVEAARRAERIARLVRALEPSRQEALVLFLEYALENQNEAAAAPKKTKGAR